MTREPRDPLDLAAKYHRQMPARIRDYLHARGLPDEVIDFHLLGWNGHRITIPIFNREGQLAFFRLARDPDAPEFEAKMLGSPGASLELYGWGDVLSKPARILICEGEFDRLVLVAQGFHAASSTGGAGTFRPEWVPAFAAIPEVFLCFDRDEAGRRGALRVGGLIPHAKLVELPNEVDEGGDVTDFFVRLGRTAEDFERLLAEAKPVPPAAEPSGWSTRPIGTPSGTSDESPGRERVERLKRAVPIATLVGRYVTLRQTGGTQAGLCPFHEDHIPSLTVYPERGRYFCYGCGTNGDVITFLRSVERLSFPEALDRLEELATPHEPKPEDNS